MPNDKDAQIQEWLRRVHDDELTIRSILKHKDAAPSNACFIAHQIAEKYLKIFLLFERGRFPKIHALDKLLEECMKSDISFVMLKKEAILLNDYYIETRYPADVPEGFSWKIAAEAHDAAIKVKEFVVNKINKSN